MKLLSNLKNIIFEISGPRKYVDKFIYDDKQILLLASYHQSEERFGIKSFEEILNIYYNDGSEIRFGVPNNLIKKLFKQNFEKIYNEINKVETKSEDLKPRLNIVKNRQEQNELENNPEDFDFIEFVIQKNSENKYEIITSAFSKDGKFLKLFGKSKNSTPKLVAETEFHFYLTITI